MNLNRILKKENSIDFPRKRNDFNDINPIVGIQHLFIICEQVNSIIFDGGFRENLPIILQLKCQSMNRQNWSSQEDSALRKFVQKLGVTDWTSIAENLRIDCQNSTRTGKQCRERWYNHLISTVNKKSWTAEEEKKLFQTHRIYGNKWKDIAKEIDGRTDNDIKNHFYSTLRRSLRRLNKIIGEKNSTSQIREIKPSVLTTIMEFIYRSQNTNAQQLLSSLKDLPMLIMEFASFKPKKGNYANKLNDEARDKIQTILLLVSEFNTSYCREKKQSKLCKSQKKEKSPKNIDNKANEEQIPGQMQIEPESIQEQEVLDQEQMKVIGYVKTETEMNNSFMIKKPISLPSQQQIIPSGIAMFDDDYNPSEMPALMEHLEDPSAFQQDSQVFGLEIVGMHWSPQIWERVEQDQLDEVLEMNYDNL